MSDVSKNDQGKPLLEISNLSVAYGKVEALTNFNMRVNEGQIVSVVGPMVQAKPHYCLPLWDCLVPRAMWSLMALLTSVHKWSVWW